jgi:hypothetical protein
VSPLVVAAVPVRRILSTYGIATNTILAAFAAATNPLFPKNVLLLVDTIRRVASILATTISILPLYYSYSINVR